MKKTEQKKADPKPTAKERVQNAAAEAEFNFEQIKAQANHAAGFSAGLKHALALLEE